MDLVSMGFTAGQVAQALALSDNNSDTALELLLSGAIEEAGEATPPLFATPSATGVVVSQCTISQYSLQGGHSACTVISTMLASEALRALQPPGRNSSNQLVDLCHLFQDVITRGASLALSNDSFQHMSCEEALLLLPSSSAGAVQCGAVLQGLLHQRGCFADILRRAREGAGGQPVAIVLTKPPESVCVVLTPSRCFLFDSHSRPGEGLSNAYVVEAPSEQELLSRLASLFPPFPAQGLGEMQMLTYNSIDATVFVLPPSLPSPSPSSSPPAPPSSSFSSSAAAAAGAGAGAGEGEEGWVVVPPPPLPP